MCCEVAQFQSSALRSFQELFEVPDSVLCFNTQYLQQPGRYSFPQPQQWLLEQRLSSRKAFNGQSEQSTLGWVVGVPLFYLGCGVLAAVSGGWSNSPKCCHLLSDESPLFHSGGLRQKIRMTQSTCFCRSAELNSTAKTAAGGAHVGLLQVIQSEKTDGAKQMIPVWRSAGLAVIQCSIAGTLRPFFPLHWQSTSMHVRPVTAVALAAVNKFVSFGLIHPDHPKCMEVGCCTLWCYPYVDTAYVFSAVPWPWAASKAINTLAWGVINCRFTSSQTPNDEVRGTQRQIGLITHRDLPLSVQAGSRAFNSLRECLGRPTEDGEFAHRLSPVSCWRLPQRPLCVVPAQRTPSFSVGTVESSLCCKKYTVLLVVQYDEYLKLTLSCSSNNCQGERRS
eukprot:2618309-Amphidinium_carterae.1